MRIRGAEANHTLLFIDGIRANDPATGDFARFELLNADQSAEEGIGQQRARVLALREKLRAMDMPVIDHRSAQFGELGRTVLEGSQKIFQTSGPVVIFPSSGTGAWEAAIVNTLSPGAVETERLIKRFGDMETARRVSGPKHLLQRLGQPEEIANAAVFLASDASSFMTGADLLVDGGYTAV